MATLLELTQGLKDRLSTIAGLRTNAVEPSAPVPPAAWPFLRTGIFDQDFEGAVTWTFSIYVIVGAASDQHAQNNLMPYLAPSGAKSVRAAIEGDPTLGGVADSTRVTMIESVGSYEIGGARYIGAVLVAEVYA